MTTPFEEGKRYTFQTTAPAVLTSEIKLATYEGRLTLPIAQKFDPNLVAKFRTIFPHLAAGLSSDPADTIYHLFKMPSGETEIFADLWIQQDTITLVETVNIRVVLSDVNLTDQVRIKTALQAAGFSAFSLDII